MRKSHSVSGEQKHSPRLVSKPVVLPLDMVENSSSLFVAVFVRIWPQFGKELAPVSSKWRLFCLVTSQRLLRLAAWRIIHHI